MKSRLTLSILACGLTIVLVAPLAAADAEDGQDRAFRVAVMGGVRLMALMGRDRATEPFYRLRFPGGAMKAGWSVGIDGVWHPSFDHSLSLGVAWEQRSFVIKGADASLFVLFPAQAAVLVAGEGVLFSHGIVKTLMVSDCLVVPLVWRWQCTRNLYGGAGVEVAIPLRTHKNSTVFFYPSAASLKRRIMPAEPGARLLVGGLVGHVAVELAGAAGLINFDRFGGARHSVHFMMLARYVW